MRDYQNHARRHAAGGSDPIVQPITYAQMLQTSDQFFTSPTGFEGIPVMASFSTNNADLFADNGTNDGIDALTAHFPVTFKGEVEVSRDGAGHTNIPQYIAMGMTIWDTSGGTPGSSIVTATIREFALASGTADNQFGSFGPGFRLAFEHSISSIDPGSALVAGTSYALWLSVQGVAANWKYSDCIFQIIAS